VIDTAERPLGHATAAPMLEVLWERVEDGERPRGDRPLLVELADLAKDLGWAHGES
jgi:hypothetical protein